MLFVWRKKMKIKHNIGEKVLLEGTIKEVRIIEKLNGKAEVLYFLREIDTPIREKDILKKKKR